ncbi:MAG: hypothetical protein ACK57R_17360 [Dolichospermum sp.]|jgi:hypothetical protein|nr:hypothetical protein [Anabaena sp. 49628_E55]
MSSTNINNQEGENSVNQKGENSVNQKGENCHQKLVWTCDPNSYPRCTAQWLIECDLICHLPFSENSKDS